MADAKASDETPVTPTRADSVAIVLAGGGDGLATLGDIADLGLANFSSAVNSSSPNGTIPAVSLSVTNAATNVDLALVPKGTGALVAAVPDGTSAGGNKRGTNAVDLQTKRTSSASRVASGANSVLSGGINNTSSGSASVVAGGNLNQATSSNSVVGGGSNNVASTQTNTTVSGGDNNSATGGYATVGGGSANTASGNSTAASTVSGGDTNTASNTGATVAGGLQNTASGQYSSVLGGQQNTASGKNGVALGGKAADRGIAGALAHSPGSTIGSAAGDLQSMVLELAVQTANATPAVMVSDASAAGTSNQLLLPNGSAFVVTGIVCARQNTTGDSASWELKAHVKRGANAAATALVASCTPALIAADSGAAAWTIAVTADTTSGALAITVTGEASKTIRWGALLTSIQVVG